MLSCKFSHIKTFSVKRLTAILFFVCIANALYAQLKSPDAFLGYTPGSRYTPHYQVVSYFKHVAEQVPAMVKLQQYGETNEHRPLIIAFVSSTENIQNLEEVRKNNLRLAHLSQDMMAPVTDAPAIVWLSYNVHGNETSSSEAAMRTLYELVNAGNNKTKTWLQNTIVAIDPCLNPDGRDRYVNWFNSTVGAMPNASLNAREHREPWPGGRTNHYNFDLNRDWAWQTQAESRARLAVYQQWMPQVHVDFHEQGINAPYYFAPAAEPYHEAISKWQRDFQVIIGRNHAKYFDQNNWLYFTREIFDLFYPSYGDTYPLYNGSIGMTYEQGGGPAAGITSETYEGDTLTLTDRINHHFTTGMSTIEVASQNATQLVKEFKKLFDDAVQGNLGKYKTYVVKNNPGDEQRITSLLQLLEKNGISYGNASGSLKGYHYQTKKEEHFSIGSKDIVISAAQPKAVLLGVLFEPESKLVDSNTYDITAWALPYAYGLDAYASVQKINVAAPKTDAFINNVASDAYAYVVPWGSLASARVAAALMNKDVRLRFSEAGFEAAGSQFGRGSFIIAKKGNERFGDSLWRMVTTLANENKLKTYQVQSGMVDRGFDFGSSYVRPFKGPRVLLFTGEGINSNAAGEVWHFFDKELNYPVTLANVADFSRINWKDVDLAIMPDGRYTFLSDKETAAGFEQWINNGGRVVALESAVAQLSKQEWSNIKSPEKPEADNDGKKDPYASLQVYADRERTELSNVTPGAIYKVDIDNTHPLMYGYPKYYYTLKMDNAVYSFFDNNGWNAGTIRKENLVAGFVGYKLSSKLRDGLLFGVQYMGDGAVSYLADNVLFRDFWENGKLMFCNAVFMVGQ